MVHRLNKSEFGDLTLQSWFVHKQGTDSIWGAWGQAPSYTARTKIRRIKHQWKDSGAISVEAIITVD